MQRFYKPTEVARALGVSDATVSRWIKKGKLEAVRLPSGRPIVPAEAVEQILQR